MSDEADRSGEGWSGSIGGFAPVQGFGEVDGVPWYFRARHEHWSLEIGVGLGPDHELTGEAVFEAGGRVGDEEFCASHLDLDEAWALIEGAIAEYRAEKARAALAAEGVTP